MDTIDVDASCPICLKTMKRACIIQTCYHLYCFSCIRLWADHLSLLGSKRTCPLCKQEFDTLFTDFDAEEYTKYSFSHPPPDTFGYRVREAIYAGRIQIYQIDTQPVNDVFAMTTRKTYQQVVEWIERDLRVCLGQQEDLTVLLSIIESVVQRYGLDRVMLQQELQDYLFDKATIFANELYLFATSRWNMQTYDSQVEYRCIHDADCDPSTCLVTNEDEA